MLRNSLNQWTKKTYPPPPPKKKKKACFWRRGVFLFFIFLFSDIWSNQCSQMKKSIFWFTRNICRVIEHRFFCKISQKNFRYRKIGEKLDFSLCKFARILYEEIFRKNFFFVFFLRREEGLNLNFLILDTWWNHSSQLQKRMLWTTQNVHIQSAGHSFIIKNLQKRFRLWKISRNGHFSLCKFPRIFQKQNLKKHFLKQIDFFLGNRQTFWHKKEIFVKNHNYKWNIFIFEHFCKL